MEVKAGAGVEVKAGVEVEAEAGVGAGEAGVEAMMERW